MEAVNINIKSMDGNSFSLKISMNDTVLSLKNMIHELRALEVERQRIIYRGRVLRDTDILSGHGLEEGHTIHLVPRPVGIPASPMTRAHPSPSLPQNSPVMVGQAASNGDSATSASATAGIMNGIMGSILGGGGLGGGLGGGGGGLSNSLQAALAGALGGRPRHRDHLISEGLPEGRQLEHLHQAILTMNTLVSTMPLEETMAREMVQQAQQRRQRYPLEFFENSTSHETKQNTTTEERKEGESKNNTDTPTPPTPPTLRTGSSGLEEDLLLPNVSSISESKNNNTATPRSSSTSLRVPRLYQGQWLDVQDTVNQWLEATVLDVSSDKKRIHVHYNGWPSRWDEWIESDSLRVAPFRTKTLHSSATPHTSPSPVAYAHTSTAPVVGVNDIRYVLPRVDALLHSVLPLFDRVVQMGIDQRGHEKNSTSLATEREKERENEEASGLLSPSSASATSATSVSNQEWEGREELRTHAEYLAPLMDRLGRLMSDLAPHIASIADAPYYDARRSGGAATTGAATSTTPTTPATPAPATPATSATPTTPVTATPNVSSASDTPNTPGITLTNSNHPESFVEDVDSETPPPLEPPIGNIQRSPIVGPATPHSSHPSMQSSTTAMTTSATTATSSSTTPLRSPALTTSPYRRLVATPVATGVANRSNIDIHIHAVMPMGGGGGNNTGGGQLGPNARAQLAALAGATSGNGQPRRNMHQEILSAGGLESFLSNIRSGNVTNNTTPGTSSEVGATATATAPAPVNNLPQPLSSGRNIPAEILAAGGLENFLGVGSGLTSSTTTVAATQATTTTESTESTESTTETSTSPSRSLRGNNNINSSSSSASSGNRSEGMNMLFNLLQQSNTNGNSATGGSGQPGINSFAQGVQRRRIERQRILLQSRQQQDTTSIHFTGINNPTRSPNRSSNRSPNRSPNRSSNRSPNRSPTRLRSSPNRSPNRLSSRSHLNSLMSNLRRGRTSGGEGTAAAATGTSNEVDPEVEEVRNMFLGTGSGASSGIRRNERRTRTARNVFSTIDAHPLPTVTQSTTSSSTTTTRPPRGARDLLNSNNPSGVVVPPMFDSVFANSVSSMQANEFNTRARSPIDVTNSTGGVGTDAGNSVDELSGCSTQIS